jgi:hypothetical protein
MRSADQSRDGDVPHVPWWLATILTLAWVVVTVWLGFEFAVLGHEWALWVLIGAAGVLSVVLSFDVFRILERAPADTG